MAHVCLLFIKKGKEKNKNVYFQPITEKIDPILI